MRLYDYCGRPGCFYKATFGVARTTLRSVIGQAELDQAAEKMVQAAVLISAQPIALQLRFLQTVREISGDKSTTTFLRLPIGPFRPSLQRGAAADAEGPCCLPHPNAL